MAEENYIELKELGEESNYYTEKLSDVNRKLAFAGIAIIWLFRIEQKIDSHLILPLILLVLCLGADLMHYLYYSLFCIISFKWHKLRNRRQDSKSENDKIYVSPLIKFIGMLIFYIKVACSIAAYILIFIYLWKAIL